MMSFLPRLAFSWILLFPMGPAFGENYITVAGAGVKKAKIAVGRVHPLPDFKGYDYALAKRVRDQLMSDLEFTNLFEFLPETAFAAIDTPAEVATIQYEPWSEKQVSFVIKLGYRIVGSKMVVEGTFYDIPGRKRIFGTRYQYPLANYQKLVHAIVEDILKEVTKEKGLFFSRILMSCRDLRRRKNPPKEIYVMDADGRNAVQLTTDNSLSLSPSWGHDGKHIIYTQFEWRMYGRTRKKGTVIKVHDLQTGRRSVLSAKDGMNSGGAWSPDGSKVAVTLSFSGRPEIYFIQPSNPDQPEPLSRNIQWKRLGSEGFQPTNPQQLLDVEPNWSPDSKKLVFSSARTGHPMIYTVDLSTRIATQLTFAGIYNASPAWSPRGDRIVFSTQKLEDGNFELYLIDPDGNNLNRLTMGESFDSRTPSSRRARRRANNENPTWAPTGRHIAYSSDESGVYAIYAVTSDGAVKRRISPPDLECFNPSWGPAEN